MHKLEQREECRGRETEGKESQADSEPSVESPMQVDPTTLKSPPELKPRVRRLTQVPLIILLI